MRNCQRAYSDTYTDHHKWFLLEELYFCEVTIFLVALGVFRWMLTAGVRPDEVTFLGVLCACSHTGMVKECRHYLDYTVLSCEIQPNIKRYGCTVDLLSRVGLLDEAQQLIHTIPMKPSDVIWEIAKYVGDHIFELEPDRAAGHLKTKQRMAEMRVKKPSGRNLKHENASTIRNRFFFFLSKPSVGLKLTD
ncbi:hypothetical protein MKX03_014850 [Papaver bracteatum]|nr:hypothetical protein MKX03_014850 [Papaver bracteatum]